MIRGGNRLTLLENGTAYFPDLIAGLDGARWEIHLETYIFEADATGLAVAAALKRAARRGVVTRLLLDGFGSRALPGEFLDALRGAGVEVQGENLGRLTWVYLKLLTARRSMSRVLKDPTLNETEEIEARLEAVRRRLADPGVTDELKKSLEQQAEILEQRVKQRTDGRAKLDFLEAEILRIQEQLELLREQAALSTDAAGLSSRLDEITGSLGGASAWLADQQKMYGSLDDLLEEPPAVAARATLRETQ